jgi:hypothetical protein
MKSEPLTANDGRDSQALVATQSVQASIGLRAAALALTRDLQHGRDLHGCPTPPPSPARVPM